METLNRYDQLRGEAGEFHRKHPRVWELFDRFTRDRIGYGYQHYSAKAIWERIRWETDQAKTEGDEFKLNNNYPSFYARAWMGKNPEYQGFFRTRTQISKAADAVNQPELGPSDFPEEA